MDGYWSVSVDVEPVQPETTACFSMTCNIFYARDALLQTLVDLELTDNWQHRVDGTVVGAHSQAIGAKEVLILKLLVGHAAALRARSIPDVRIRDVLSALPSPVARPRVTKPQRPDNAACPEPESQAGRLGL